MGNCPRRQPPVDAVIENGEEYRRPQDPLVRSHLARAAGRIAQPRLRAYLSIRTGLAIVQSRRARRHWRIAVNHVKNWLRIRKQFHNLGVLLQEPRIKDLFSGVRRIRGQVRRDRPAPVDHWTFSV